MKRPECSRTWQAEVIEDGRLSGPDRASFERHVEVCAICTREVCSLARIRSAAAELPVLESAPLERRRLRNELLRRANEVTQRAPRPHASWARVVAWGAAFAAAIVVAVLVARSSARIPAGPGANEATLPVTIAAVDVPTFQITPSERSAWRTVERGPTVRLAVERGAFEFDVDTLRAGQRFLVSLPDGELEVQGTRFMVHVSEAATLRVAVTEGRVALRLAGRGEMVLVAGDAWPVVSTEPTRAGARDEHQEIGRAPAVSRSGARPRSGPEAPTASSASAAGAPRSSSKESAGAAFAAAMAAFSIGDFGRAERLFLVFEQQHPRDARAEDAAFLRAITRSKRGDDAGARALARDYLDRYPAGLRRLEAERLTR